MGKFYARLGWGLAFFSAWPLGAGAEEPMGNFWGNTANACVESSVAAPETHAGSVIWALLLVLGLLALLAWWLKRWRRPAPAAAGKPQGRLLLLNRFNAAQSFMLWEEAGKTYALIMKNQRVEMLTELPGGSSAGSERVPPAGIKAPKTFQEIWINLIKPTRKP
jgi:flagellar biogenesis protein FliO